MKKLKVILDEKKIQKLLKIRDVIKIVEEGFRKKGLGLVDLPPKIGPKLESDVPGHRIQGAFAEAMPVSLFEGDVKGEVPGPRVQIFGIKWQSAFKSNIKKGIPYLNNLIILNEPKCGLPIAILRGNWITAIRTGGVSAVCAKYLAPKKKRLTIGIFGLGLQAYVHILAFKSVFKNPQFLLFEHDSKLLRRFLKKFPKEKFLTSKNFHEVVRNSDIILSATTFPPKITPYIYARDLKDDVLILPLEYGTRIDPKLYKYLDEIYTDDIPQYELKGKIRNYFPSSRPKIAIEIGELISGKYKRKSKPKRILVFNLGIALFDILVANHFLRKFKG